MQVFIVPSWVWFNLALFIAAAIVVAVKLSAAKTTEGRNSVSADFGRAAK